MRPGRLAVGVAVIATAVAAMAWARPTVAPTPRTEAAIVAKQALDYFNAGQFAIAAELYRKAARVDPARPEYLFGAARAEQRQGRATEALALFEQLLALLPASEPLHAKASKEAAALRQVRDSQPPPAAPPAVVEPPPATPTTLPAPATPTVIVRASEPPPAAPSRTAAWLAFGAGGLGVAAAAGFAWLAVSEQSELDDKRLPGDPEHYDPRRITADEIRATQGSVNTRWTLAAVAGGVALGGLGAGAWLWQQVPNAQLGLSVTANGVTVAGRF